MSQRVQVGRGVSQCGVALPDRQQNQLRWGICFAPGEFALRVTARTRGPSARDASTSQRPSAGPLGERRRRRGVVLRCATTTHARTRGRRADPAQEGPSSHACVCATLPPTVQGGRPVRHNFPSQRLLYPYACACPSPSCRPGSWPRGAVNVGAAPPAGDAPPLTTPTRERRPPSMGLLPACSLRLSRRDGRRCWLRLSDTTGGGGGGRVHHAEVGVPASTVK